MLFLLSPQYVTDVDGVELTCDAVVRLAVAAATPLSRDAVDLLPHLPDRAVGMGRVFVRESAPAAERLDDTDGSSIAWWPIEEDEATWLLENCSFMASNQENDATTSQASTPGLIYIMRSPAMDRDIYKIGRTTGSADKRARELSSATGVASEFLVVEEWHVDDCVTMERACHRALKAYRLSGRREFFRAPYKVIRHTVDATIQALTKHSLPADKVSPITGPCDAQPKNSSVTH